MIALLLCHPLMAAETSIVGSFTWRSDEANHGGFSGLHVSSDGNTFVTISDRAYATRGEFTREDGAIVGVSADPLTKLASPKGIRLSENRTDTEGLAVGNDGMLYVSLEGVHRIWAYPNTAYVPKQLPQHPSFKNFQDNSGLEGLAIDRSGALYTLQERSGKLTRPFTVFRFKNGKWDDKLTISREGDFLPTGADFGPDGKFYVLERSVRLQVLLTSRVRRFDLTKAGFVNEETVLETISGRHDNLEGLSVWQDQDGKIRLTMISDDNFKSFQKTEFVEYRID